jgi:hypothetical protein
MRDSRKNATKSFPIRKIITLLPKNSGSPMKIYAYPIGFRGDFRKNLRQNPASGTGSGKMCDHRKMPAIPGSLRPIPGTTSGGAHYSVEIKVIPSFVVEWPIR